MDIIRYGNYGNVYLDVAQSAYIDQPFDFERLLEKDAVRIDYAKAKRRVGKTVEQLGVRGDPVVYLQPDRVENRTADGMRAFVVTFVRSLADADHAVFVVRGTESALVTDPDWTRNNVPFAFDLAQPEQTDSALAAWRTVARANPQVTRWDFTGHSLATMVIASMIARLSVTERQLVGRAVLFNGPDVGLTLNEMEVAQLQGMTKAGQMEYYLASHDVISLYNREQWSGIGFEHFISAPTNTSLTPTVTAHWLGEYEVDAVGNIMEDRTPKNVDYARKLAQRVTGLFMNVHQQRELFSGLDIQAVLRKLPQSILNRTMPNNHDK